MRFTDYLSVLPIVRICICPQQDFCYKKSIFSVDVLKHTILKENKPLSWHKNLTRITYFITNSRGLDRNMINQSFIFYTFHFHNTFGPGRWEKLWKWNVSTIFLPFCSDWTRWVLNNFKIWHFYCQIYKYLSHENSILWLDIVLSCICSEIEKVNTQFVVGKFCNKNPVVFPKKGI